MAVLFGPLVASGAVTQSNTAFGNLVLGPLVAAGNALGAHQAQGSPLFGPLKASIVATSTNPASGKAIFGALVASSVFQHGSGLFGPMVAVGTFVFGLTPNQLAGIQTVFAPPKKPQAPLDIAVQPRLLNPQFGQGYPYTAPDGINVSLRSVSLKFEPLTQAEFLLIDAFFNAYGQLPFWYLLPDETTRRQWVMMSRTRRIQSTFWGYDLTIAEQPQL